MNKSQADQQWEKEQCEKAMGVYHCPHPPEHVTADILEGDWNGHQVQWCRLCGAYRRTGIESTSDWRTVDEEKLKRAVESHTLKQKWMPKTPEHPVCPECENTNKLRKQIETAINRNCAENKSNTPDFILAEFLMNCLQAFDRGVVARERWYGKKP